MSKVLDLTGHTFGRLTVIKRVPKPEGIRNGTYWLCSCACGNTKVVWSSSLVEGHTTSCGCKRKEDFVIRSLPKGESAFNRLYRNYKRKAEQRGYSFELSKEEFKHFTEGNCFYCGKSPQQEVKTETHTGSYFYNGVDRVDPSKGYNLSNCVSCCQRCNRAKSDFSLQDFYEWVKVVYELQERR